MQKQSYREDIAALSFSELITEIERNKRDLEHRWTKSKRFGAGVRNTSKLEHRQVLLYDRLVNIVLGNGWEDSLELVEYMMRWSESKRKEYEELKNKTS